MARTKFDRAFSALPACMVGTMADDAETLADLIFACRVQLDLIQEEQDGTEEDDPAAISRWLRKWAG